MKTTSERPNPMVQRSLRAALAAACLCAAAGAQVRTPDVVYVPTPHEVVDAMLKLAEVQSADIVYDLGSGDGRILIAAAQKYGARGVGIEIDPALVKQATANAAAAGVADKIRFVNADLFEADIREATVVTLYLLESLNEKLRPKLLRELKPGTRIVSHRFRMGDWLPERAASAGDRGVYLWRIPAR
jgi:SAM-dependent methyltransferase